MRAVRLGRRSGHGGPARCTPNTPTPRPGAEPTPHPSGAASTGTTESPPARARAPVRAPLLPAGLGPPCATWGRAPPAARPEHTLSPARARGTAPSAHTLTLIRACSVHDKARGQRARPPEAGELRRAGQTRDAAAALGHLRPPPAEKPQEGRACLPTGSPAHPDVTPSPLFPSSRLGPGRPEACGLPVVASLWDPSSPSGMGREPAERRPPEGAPRAGVARSSGRTSLRRPECPVPGLVTCV